MSSPDGGGRRSAARIEETKLTAPKFGTSGLRGLVTELTPDLVADHVRAFLASCPTGGALWVGRDLRPSSPALAQVVLETARAEGFETVDCGAVPTPALALAAMGAGAAAVMATGSHIPADRNGLKFYTPHGEIDKAQEAAIVASLGRAPESLARFGPGAPTRRHETAGAEWTARYVRSFGARALRGLRLGVWSHSAASRDLVLDLVASLGAEPVELGRSAAFVPVDTEAVSAEARAQLRIWASERRLDAILSTDGDGDRPLLTDGAGEVVPGDVLGQITAARLGAETVATPLNSNTGVEAIGVFGQVIRTRIGSPYVIAAMEAALKSGGAEARVVGYEANGGFVLGFAAHGPAGPLAPLMTRDSLLPMLTPLAAARRAGVSLAELAASQPARFTAADRLEHVATERAQAFIAGLAEDSSRRAAFLARFGESFASEGRADGLRLTLASGRILHLRASGNAPELRLYVEAESAGRAAQMLSAGLGFLRETLG